MAESQLIVQRIREGTVLDHLEPGTALQVLEALRIGGADGNIVTVAMNVPSRKMGKKDIVKVENRFLRPAETNRIVLIAPKATVNLIRDYKVVEKRSVELPDVFVSVFRCPNPTCVSNANEPISPTIRVVRSQPPLLQCKYCARVFEPNEVLD